MDEVSRHLKPPIVVVLLFAAMFLDSMNFPGLGVPISSIAAGMVVLYALAAPQRISISHARAVPPLWFVFLVLAIPGWLAITSLVNGSPDTRRLLNIGVYAAVMLTVAGQRLSLRAVGRGLALAVVAGVAIGALLLPRSSYSGRMTGPLGDPNSAGYIIVVFTFLALPSIERRKYRISLVAVAAVGVLLTQSRTSMLAMALMTLWIVLSRYASSWISVPIVALVLFGANSAAESLAPEAFAGRAGSDQLRQRIHNVELAEIAVSPIIGHGAGTAHVALDGLIFFFHSSYLALRAEAGWIGLAIVVGLFGLVFLRLLAFPRTHRNYYYEAALIGVAVCAINLGEVLLALPAAFAAGLSLRHTIQPKALADKHSCVESAAARDMATGGVGP